MFTVNVKQMKWNLMNKQWIKNASTLFCSIFTLGLCLSFAYSPAPLAEEIRIPIGSQSPQFIKLERPLTGWKKSKILDTFGEPKSVAGPVGSPPITQWHYANFTVYLENNTVIHSVLSPSKKLSRDNTKIIN